MSSDHHGLALLPAPGERNLQGGRVHQGASLSIIIHSTSYTKLAFHCPHIKCSGGETKQSFGHPLRCHQEQEEKPHLQVTKQLSSDNHGKDNPFTLVQLFSEKLIEEIMFRYLELCVDLKKSHVAKEGLFQYRNMCQVDFRL